MLYQVETQQLITTAKGLVDTFATTCSVIEGSYRRPKNDRTSTRFHSSRGRELGETRVKCRVRGSIGRSPVISHIGIAYDGSTRCKLSILGQCLHPTAGFRCEKRSSLGVG